MSSFSACQLALFAGALGVQIGLGLLGQFPGAGLELLGDGGDFALQRLGAVRPRLVAGLHVGIGFLDLGRLENRPLHVDHSNLELGGCHLAKHQQRRADHYGPETYPFEHEATPGSLV